MNKILSRWTTGATFLFFALSLAIKGGYNYGAGLLFLAALLGLPWWWRDRARDPFLRWLAFGLLAAGLLGIADAWFSGLSPTHYNLPGKYLCIPLLLYFLATFPPDARAVWYGAACGAILGVLTALYYSHYTPELLPMGRGARYLHPIQLGNIAVLLALLSACGLKECKRTGARLLLAAGVFAGIYTALLSETRGSFFALGFALCCLLAMHIRQLRSARRPILIGSALFVVVLVLAGDDIIAKRFADIADDLRRYAQGDSATSIGARFELWRFAVIEGMRYPVFGAGTAQLLADKALWLQSHPARDFIAPLFHFHNEFIDAFARRGLIGLATMLYLFCLPLAVYARARQAASATQLAASGHLLLYIGFSFTQATLYVHSSGFMFFTVPLCLLYGIWRQTTLSPTDSDHAQP